jgi:polyhydroxyalkanoate synthesis regulator phasin
MLDTVRKYVEAGREALTSKKAEELARELVKQGQARRDQAGRVAKDLREWSKKNSERLRDTISREVKKQISRAGVATKDEVESLKRRIRKLESGRKTSRKAGSRKTSTARKRPAPRKGGGAGAWTRSWCDGAWWQPSAKLGTPSWPDG